MIRYRVLAQAVSLFAGSMACAQIDAEAWQTNATFATNPAGAPYIRVPLGLIPATLYADGSRVQTENEQVWRYVCGSHGETTTDALARDVQIAKTSLAESAGVPTTTRGSGGLDIVFNPNGSVPAAAVAALADVEAYIESQFDNETTMTIDVSFASMNPNVIGVTGNIFVQTPWMDARPALRASMDFDDEIQDFLPTGAVPVRYSPNGSVSNELRVFFSRGNYRAVVGSISGSVAQITLNSQYNFDYNPANGVPGSATSFIDVMVHEVGHMLGFVSGVDDRVNDIDVLDLFRFRRGSDPNNPSTLAEFTTTPRLAVFDAPGTDQSNSDIITDEYRMSDGNPYQASHFREVSIGSPIGIMDPALAGGETFYPNYYQTADLKMFDAIGYIYPPCDHPSIN
ncbi:MAG: NF038122 family metalloprotease, partial [Phycisphaerales bacterium]|nr:NF038122 family metalloprotease [Phycisphaerales bacterium]